MMKKIGAILCMGVMMISTLSGCGIQPNGGNTATPEPSQPVATPTPVPDDITEKTDYTTQVWVATEIAFTADVEVEDITQAELDVTFTNRKTGTAITVPGFWDGGKDWKVRFAPTEYGIWDFLTVTVGDEVGLNGLKGTVAANAYKGELEIYKRGFVRTDEGKKYFVYDDGTPFFYLGDTHWRMINEEFDSAGPLAGTLETNSHFKYIVDRRVAQGFTVYQSQPLSAGLDVSTGKVNKNNIEAFQRLDKYYQYVAEKGLLHTNSQFFLPTAQAITKEYVDNMESLARFWVARYSAYPVMWTLGQECDRGVNIKVDVQEMMSYVQLCKLMYELDPYKHPISAHQLNARNVGAAGGATVEWIDIGDGTKEPELIGTGKSNRSMFCGITGHTWWAAQWKPWFHKQYEFDIPRDYWENGDGKPIVNYEAKYHNLHTGDYGARVQAWITYLSGMCGYGYGAQNMWEYNGTYGQNDDSFDGIEVITSEKKKSVTWAEMIDAPISAQLTYLRGFLENIGWYELTPDFDSGNAFRPVEGGEDYYACAYIRDEVYVTYLYGKTVNSAGKLVNMDKNAVYVAQWFDTRTGEYTLIDYDLTADENGEYHIPQKPVADDMILLVTKK